MSEQDFFFDDDESVPAKAAPKPAKAAPKPAKAAKAVAASPVAPAAAPEAQDFFSQSVSMSIAALLAVCALLVGVIVGVMLPVGGSGVGGVGSTSSLPGGALQPAPQLSQEQITNGELPAGHPDIGGGSTAATATK